MGSSDQNLLHMGTQNPIDKAYIRQLYKARTTDIENDEFTNAYYPSNCIREESDRESSCSESSVTQ